MRKAIRSDQKDEMHLVDGRFYGCDLEERLKLLHVEVADSNAPIKL